MTNRDDSSNPPTSTPADQADRLARIALTWLIEPGNRTVWSMIQQAGAPATLEQVLAGDIPDASLRASVTARAASGDARRFAEIALRRAHRAGIRLVVPSDDEWPTQVDDLAQVELGGEGVVSQSIRPPLCLWVRGEWPVRDAFNQSVAIVGARAATPYGTHVSTDLADRLATSGWTVISGGAFGVDTAAHQAALAAGGRTVAVLAGGVDRPYPSGNTALFDRIADQGLLISEWPIGAEPLRHRFLIRNRVVAAADGTVIVESAVRSGTMQMVKPVLALNRPVMVVPGPVTSAMSVGSHAILRDNAAARLVTSAADVLAELRRTSS